MAVKTLKSVASEVTLAGQSAAQPINMHCVNDLWLLTAYSSYYHGLDHSLYIFMVSVEIDMKKK